MSSGFHQILPNLYQLPVGGTSVFVIVEDTITVVDAGWRTSGRRVVEFVQRLGRAPQEISLIVSTHYHADHIGGMAHVKARTGGRVAVHEAEVPYVQGHPGARMPNPFQNTVVGLLMTPLLAVMQPRPFAVDLQLHDGDRLSPLGGMEIVHTPGHTPGSISLYFPQHGLLIAGDALEYKGGWLDRRRQLGLPSGMVSSDMAQARESVLKLAKLDLEVLCFSHFPPIQGGAGPSLSRFAESLA
ncbi:MAG: MBL fold metallo-hydrolase [Dehalococcoidia bacterium]|nr:MBL fold metallo-hydrolase [Dehalococcoidia bacterium]MSQ16756.1 MBL fold metallo-hydrolase [Dehalococcoidia bacterium]